MKRGLANVESVLGDAPMLKFKSDNAFLTQAEVAQRSAAQAELKDALAVQIAEKQARKAAAAQAEQAREAAELVRSPEAIAKRVHGGVLAVVAPSPHPCLAVPS